MVLVDTNIIVPLYVRSARTEAVKNCLSGMSSGTPNRSR